LKDTVQKPVGLKVIDDKNGGDMTVAPSVSPDGRYIAFLSSKNLFSIDLYLADAQRGEILKRSRAKRPIRTWMSLTLSNRRARGRPIAKNSLSAYLAKVETACW
jgi:hypothetical protein